jgi:hypothetical protein
MKICLYGARRFNAQTGSVAFNGTVITISYKFLPCVLIIYYVNVFCLTLKIHRLNVASQNYLREGMACTVSPTGFSRFRQKKANVKSAMYDYTSYNWSHWNGNENLREKSRSYTRKTFDRLTTEDSYTCNITHNTESIAV